MRPLILPPAVDADDLMMPSRRRLLQAAAGTLASMALPAFGQSADFWSQPRELWLHRPATKETVREVYWADGALVAPGYIRLCELLRDTHVNQSVQFDIVTLDIARGVYGWLQAFGHQRPLTVLSGYRHASTNATEGGARNSMHTLARAIDIRIDGVSADAVARFGKYLAGGGVGFYPNKRFTHLDRGKIRYWRG